MLRLQKIQVQLAKPLFTANSRKFLRISVGNIVKNTNQPAKITNDQAIQWGQSLSFPLLYNKQFLFEIYDKHQFGFNPEQFHTVLQGNFVIDNIGENKGTWEIFTSGNQKIGFLSAQIISKVPSMIKSIMNEKKIIAPINESKQIQQEANDDKMKVFKISSMVARTPNINLKKGYVVVEVGQKQIKTHQMRSRAGELVFIESKQMNLDHNDTDAKIKIVSVKQEGEQVVAEGAMQLIGAKPSKKVVLMNQGQQVGQIYVQSKIAEKSQINNNSFVENSSNVNKSKVFNSFSASQQLEEAMKPRTKSISPSKQVDHVRLEDFGININQSRLSRYTRPTLLDSSMISSMSARRRNSVVNQNNNIVFPKEKRFLIYQDKQNERITYLKDRSFQFRSPHSGKFYRGASIGYGDKTDFTHAKIGNPGVGNYKLPSIWDRY